MFNHILDEGQLHIRRIGHDEFFASLGGVEFDGGIGENGETERAAVR